MKIFVKIPITIALGSAMLAGAVSVASAQSYRGYYVGAAPYGGQGYDSYAYAGPRRYGQFGSYELGFKGCATAGNYGRTDYSAC